MERQALVQSSRRCCDVADSAHPAWVGRSARPQVLLVDCLFSEPQGVSVAIEGSVPDDNEPHLRSCIGGELGAG